MVRNCGKKVWRPTERCKHDGCDGWAWAQGYCDHHYQKLKREGVLTKQRIFGDDLARFHTKYKVNPDTGCWEWIGGIHSNGYGNFGVAENGKGRTYRAHRFAYERLVGPIPDGMQVLHRCDVRWCVNPEHLFLGTAADNMQDCLAKGRNAQMRGTGGPSITAAMALSIRIQYAKGLVNAYKTLANPFSIKGLADLYGVSQGTIWGIVKGRSHLDG